MAMVQLSSHFLETLHSVQWCRIRRIALSGWNKNHQFIWSRSKNCLLEYTDDYRIALFGRKITNEENLKGAIDFNNLMGIVNQPRIFGIEAKVRFY